MPPEIQKKKVKFKKSVLIFYFLRTKPYLFTHPFSSRTIVLKNSKWKVNNEKWAIYFTLCMLPCYLFLKNIQVGDATGIAIKNICRYHTLENINEEQLPPNPKELLITCCTCWFFRKVVCGANDSSFIWVWKRKFG